MFNFLRRSKPSNNNQYDSNSSSRNSSNENLHKASSSTTQFLTKSPSQSPIIPRRRNRNTNFGNQNSSKNQNNEENYRNYNNNNESNLFLNKRNFSSIFNSPKNENYSQQNYNFPKSTTQHQQQQPHQYQQRSHNSERNQQHQPQHFEHFYDDFDSRNRNFENRFLNSTSSRNEFVDQGKRLNAATSASAVASAIKPTHTKFVTALKNDFNYSTPQQQYQQLNLQRSSTNDQFDNKKFSEKKYLQPKQQQTPNLNYPYNKLNKNDLNETESESERNKKKSVKFFNPIDKSRDFLNNIMAKGRHRHKHQQNKQDQQQSQQQKFVIKSKASGNQQTNSKINNDDDKYLTKNYNEINSSESNNIGYQITKSKNSPDIFKKIQQNSERLDNNNSEDEDDLLIASSSSSGSSGSYKTNYDDHSKRQRLAKNAQNYENNDTSREENQQNASADNWIENRNRRKLAEAKLQTPTAPTTTTTTTNELKQQTEQNICASSNDWIENRNRRKRELEAMKTSSLPPLTSSTTNNFSTTETFKPKSILKKSQKYQQPVVLNDDSEQQQQQLHHQWNDTKFSTTSSVEKSVSNETVHENNFISDFNKINNDVVNNLDNLSELAECDRDSFIDQNTLFNFETEKMGQSQGKTTTTTIVDEPIQKKRSRSISPPPPSSSRTETKNQSTTSNYQFNKFSNSPEPIIQEPLSPSSSFDNADNADNDTNSSIKIPKLPRIIVAECSSKINDVENLSPTESEPEILYDFETTNFINFKTHPPPQPIPPPKYPSPTTFLEDIVEEDENVNSDDEWQFVTAPTIPKEITINENTNSGLSKQQNDRPMKRHDSGFESKSPSKSKSPERPAPQISDENVIVLNSCDLIDENVDGDNNNNKNDFEFLYARFSDEIVDDIGDQNIIIESINLPDVVVCESKLPMQSNEKPKIVDDKCTKPKFNLNNDRINFNVNKSNSAGNVHFIPIQIDEESPDEEEITSKSNKLSSRENSRIENDVDEVWRKSSSSATTKTNDIETNEKRDLLNQETSLNTKLQEAQQTAYNAEQKANDLQSKINDMEIELSTKMWNIDRLEAELKSVCKEDDSVRRRLKILENDKECLKRALDDKEDEMNQKYETLEMQYNELDMKYQTLRTLASSLQTQLAIAQSDADECRLEKEKLYDEKESLLKILEDNIDANKREKCELEEKWQKEFEMLRNQNQDREDNLLMDCEWQLRTMKKNCKDKIDNAERERNDAIERTIELEEVVAEKTIEEKRFKTLQAEVRQLRGLTNDQRTSLNLMYEQVNELKAELEATNEELEEQIDEVRKIKLNSQNELDNKDREMVQKIYDAIQETADLWETKLLTEMTRLTNELDTVHNEERLEDMNKLTTEHIEEIKALTTRYVENETELRSQVQELKEKMNKYSDAAFNTRMHLDRADRDYQVAMSREEEKRQFLIDQMKKDADQEKTDLEADYQKRMNQMKTEFAKELSQTTEEIVKRHRNQLEQQWDQLVAEKEEALSSLESRHRIKLDEQEAKLRNLEVQHQRDLKDLKNAYDMDRSSLQTRDMNNSQEIEQLHRKCRCLTNLFEEMRMRYERREPRPEDLREIADLRARCEAQEHDIFLLTEKLRDMQIQIEEMYQQGGDNSSGNKKKTVRKPPPKSIPTNCDVIYEENEERESSPSSTESSRSVATIGNGNANGEDEMNSLSD